MSVRFNRQRYIIQTGGALRYALRGQGVDVVTYPDGRIEIMHGSKCLPFMVFDPLQTVVGPVDEKTLNARVDELIEASSRTRKIAPSAQSPLAPLSRAVAFRGWPIGQPLKAKPRPQPDISILPNYRTFLLCP